MSFFITFETLSGFFLFLLAFFDHMAILVVVEILWFFIFEVVIALFNIHGLSFVMGHFGHEQFLFSFSFIF